MVIHYLLIHYFYLCSKSYTVETSDRFSQPEKKFMNVYFIFHCFQSVFWNLHLTYYFEENFEAWLATIANSIQNSPPTSLLAKLFDTTLSEHFFMPFIDLPILSLYLRFTYKVINIM